MKTLTLFLLLVVSATAQLVVTAPDVTMSVVASNTAQLAQWATAITKYEAQIQNQADQIEKARELLNLQNTLMGRMGDWEKVSKQAHSIQLSAESLGTDFGVNWKTMTGVNDGATSIGYTANGLFAPSIGVSDKGVKTVAEQRLRRYAAVENMYDDVNSTFDQTEVARKKILKEIAQTAADIAEAKTQAETDILFAKLEALKAALGNVQAQRDEKMQRLLVQHALNASQKEKEDLLKENRDAENSSAELSAMGSVRTGGAGFR
jgi:hypothetical protein